MAHGLWLTARGSWLMEDDTDATKTETKMETKTQTTKTKTQKQTGETREIEDHEENEEDEEDEEDKRDEENQNDDETDKDDEYDEDDEGEAWLGPKGEKQTFTERSRTLTTSKNKCNNIQLCDDPHGVND